MKQIDCEVSPKLQKFTNYSENNGDFKIVENCVQSFYSESLIV